MKRSFHHGQIATLFDNFNLSVTSREFIGICGPANSGKTTLLNLIAGLEKADSGRIFIDDVDITQLDEAQISQLRHRQFGIVSDNSKLLAGRTALESVEVALIFRRPEEPEQRKTAEALLDRVGAHEQRGLKTAELSDEAKRRILIARVLVDEPNFLLSDAIVDGLTARPVKTLMALLRDLARAGMIVLLATRSPAIAKQTDRVVHLQRPFSR